jgi:hypothetical protein
MMDLSHLKVGDSVRLANGDIESVVTVDPDDDHMMIYLTNEKWYTHQGEWIGASENCDITEIITSSKPVQLDSLYSGPPFALVTRPDEGVIAIRYNDQLFTPAYAWPEPITDRQPTADDADADGDIQYMDAGGWFCHEFEPGADYKEGWQHTPMWTPREPDKRARTIQALQAAVEDLISVDLKTLTAAIELLGGRE